MQPQVTTYDRRWLASCGIELGANDGASHEPTDMDTTHRAGRVITQDDITEPVDNNHTDYDTWLARSVHKADVPEAWRERVAAFLHDSSVRWDKTISPQRMLENLEPDQATIMPKHLLYEYLWMKRRLARYRSRKVYTRTTSAIPTDDGDPAYLITREADRPKRMRKGQPLSDQRP